MVLWSGIHPTQHLVVSVRPSTTRCSVCRNYTPQHLVVVGTVEREYNRLMAHKVKITKVGQPCRHCQTPVIEGHHAKIPKPNRSGYYFEKWLKCPNCRALYMLEEFKRYFPG